MIHPLVREPIFADSRLSSALHHFVGVADTGRSRVPERIMVFERNPSCRKIAGTACSYPPAWKAVTTFV